MIPGVPWGKILSWFVVIGLAFAIFRDGTATGNKVGQVGSGVAGFLGGLIDFFSAVVSLLL